MWGAGMRLLSLLLLLPQLGLSGCGDPLLQQPYDLLYTSGLREYHRAEWRRAVPLLERSVLGHSALRRLRSRCRERCGRDTPVGGPDPDLHPSWGDPLAPLSFFRSLLSRADCLQHCLSPSLGAPSRHRVTAELRSAFHSRTAYNYLQLSYYKLNQLDKAAAAAQTFFVANPDHLEMLDNLEKYRNMEGMKAEYFKDLEAQPHWEAYEGGTRLYQSEQFPESIQRLEDTVREYMTALAECQAQCEGPYNFRDYSYLEYQSHLYEAISDHYVQVLGCNQGCVREVATKPGRVAAIDDFLPSLFSFLQYAYHKVGNYEKAVECSRTVLLFHPEDRSVHQNLAFYESKLTANRAAEILPREDIKWYIEKSLLEKEMLYFTMDTLGIPFNDPDSWTPAELIPQSIQEKLKAEREAAQKNSSEITNVVKEVAAMSTEKEGDIDLLKASSPLFANLKVAMNSNQLNGSQRVVLDGVLSHKECAAIRSLANAAADSRDGSRAGRSPHTPNEHFEGLTILKALKLARDGVVDRDGVRLFYEASELTRTIVENYFRLKTPLHFSFSHLVCRTALTDHQERRDDLSHPVHADNCLLDPEAMACWKEPPADTARDYSAVLYLNDEFEGGEFFFTEPDAKTVSAQILPRCGRLVTFTSGGENPHGVRGVTGGQRCAVALWFTLDHRHSEKERVRAETLMEQLFPSPPSSAGQEGAQPRAPPLTPVPPRVSRAPKGKAQGEGSEKQKTRKKKKASNAAAAAESPRKDEL